MAFPGAGRPPAGASAGPGGARLPESGRRPAIRTAYTETLRPPLVSASQEIAHRADDAQEPAAAPAVAVPRTGEKFSDEELRARFGVPAWGGIRVNPEKRCVVLVDLAASSKRDDTGRGDTVSYTGQNSDRGGVENQEMSGNGLVLSTSKDEPPDPCERRRQAASNNLALGTSKEEGYTVLYFTRERGGDRLRFDSLVECDSHCLAEQRAGGRRRNVIKFKLRRVNAAPDAAASKMESLGCPWVAELEEDKLSTETVGEYIARMANRMEPGLCTQEDAEEMDEGLRELARGEYVTLDELRAEFGSKRTR